tara:strand:+ start:1870 stop:3102 length:1233 start_codon:yes stop_codon:yes gene_type:complete
LLKTKLLLDIEKIRKDFPILKRKINDKPLVYFDNSATSQKPYQVIEAISNFYEQSNSNVHRGVHKLSEEATDYYESAHVKVANMINASSEEIIFTKNSTESMNLLAYSLIQQLKPTDEIVLTEMEHHSNLVPWQQLAKQKGIKIRYIEVNEDGSLNKDSITNSINKNTKIVSLTHISNALGTINPIKEISKLAHDHNALVIVDGAQSVPHMKVDVQELGCDFLIFSSHKMLGPLGLGILYGKKELLIDMPPFLYGGDMIREVSLDDSSFNELPWKFEAGTPNIAGAVGLSAAIKYLSKIGFDKIQNNDNALTEYAIEKLSQIKNLTLHGPKTRGAIVSFNIKGTHSHDIASILDSEGIAIRAGHHCCMPLMKKLNIQGTARASFYLYNTIEEVDKLITAINKVKRIFKIE